MVAGGKHAEYLDHPVYQALSVVHSELVIFLDQGRETLLAREFIVIFKFHVIDLIDDGNL